MNEVVVLGSANLDVISTLPSIPAPGETVLSVSREHRAGGKGLNQAVAAARGGASTLLIGAVGDDDAATLLLAEAEAAGIDTSLVRRVAGASGTAWIMVRPDGENAIVVDSGANASVESLTEAEATTIRAGRVLVAQLETPLAAVVEAMSLARSASVTTVLNAAPAQELPDELLSQVDVLVVNEHEARQLGDVDHLLRQVGAVVVTLGADGALLADPAGRSRVAGVPATVVDTTGAGDTFTGVLAAALARDHDLDTAAARAVVAGALTVEAAGAVPSIPTAAAVDARLTNVPRPADRPTEVPLERGADLSVLDEAKILAAPADPADRPVWRAALHRWREEARSRTAYDAAAYDDPGSSWAATAWNVAMVWLWDEVVRDWEAGRFDVGRLLDAYDDVGGLDAVVLWHAYPVIGIDRRNQFDFYDVPGLRQLVDDLHARGVRVFVDYNPWDVGTRRTAHTDATRLAELVGRLGVDGVFLDTLKEGDPKLLETMASLSPRPVLEGESRVPLARIGDHQASWAQWFADSPVPGVLRARWFEQRHQMHHTRRWNRDHRDEIRSAWVNGVGVLLWDVVFGVRVDWTEADRHAVRRMRDVYRHLGRFVTAGDWEPLTDLHAGATAAGVAGSRWRLEGCDLLTLANPTETDWTGALLADDDGTTHVVLGDGSVPTRGIAGVLRVPAGAEPPAGLDPLVAGNAGDPAPSNRAVEIPQPRRVVPERAAGDPAPGAVVVAAGERLLPVRWRQRETGLYEAAAYVDDWKPLPPRLHQPREAERRVSLRGAAVDPGEVTNDGFAVFLADSGYRPAESHRFLAHWVDGAPARGTGDQPVTHVDLDDARAYARWRGARLPTEDEWQVAAGSSGFVRGEPLVWQWTESEHRDGRTRWVVLKGGSWWAAEGSDWYVDGGPQDPEWAVRFLLTQGGTGRSETSGFRCAVDLREGES